MTLTLGTAREILALIAAKVGARPEDMALTIWADGTCGVGLFPSDRTCAIRANDVDSVAELDAWLREQLVAANRADASKAALIAFAEEADRGFEACQIAAVDGAAAAKGGA